MACVFRTDGTKLQTKPENGVSFQLKELYALLGVDIIEIIQLKNDLILVCDEEGKLKADPEFNPIATFLYQEARGPVDEIYGNVLVCKDAEVQ